MKRNFLSLMFSLLLVILSQSSKGQYLVKQADVQYNLFNYIKAIELYDLAYQKHKSLYLAQRLADCYERTNDYEKTETWAAVAREFNNNNPENILRYARALQGNAKYEEARIQFEKYQQLNNKISAGQLNLWLSSCDSAMYWLKNAGTAVISNEKDLNTVGSDWGVSKFGKGIVFSSDREDSANDSAGMANIKKPFVSFDGTILPDKTIYGWTGHHYSRLYAQIGGSSAITKFRGQFGTSYHIGPASFTADGKEMYFALTRLPSRLKYNREKLATLNVEIYSCKKGSDGLWEAPQAFFLNKIDEYSVADPSISPDGSVLYFSANLPGGKGGTDLYACTRLPDGGWGQPVNIEMLNTPGNERTPFFDGDKSFYFSSDGLIGMGKLDIFKAAFIAGKMSRPVNMGYPVNSPQDDFAFVLIRPNEGYLSSNRTGGMGADDIYSFRKQEPLALTLSGVIYNKQTKKPLDNVTVGLIEASGNMLKMQTDAEGRYKFNLKSETGYYIKGEKTGFLSNKLALNTSALNSVNELKQDLFLDPILINKVIRLENINYEFNKFDLTVEAERELDKLVKIMLENPTLWIEIASHTDSRGSSKYNLWLSQSRANSTKQYLIDQGVNSNRISAIGYGESRLLNRCKDGVVCSEIEHQMNRRTEFKIVKQ